MWRIIFFFFYIASGSCDFSKYGYDDWGHLIRDWKISDHPNRPCRAEEGWHRCESRKESVSICVMRRWASYDCQHRSPLKCNDDEIQVYDDTKAIYRCFPRFRIREFRRFKDIYLPCQHAEFECELSKRCIPRAWVRDGEDDCSVDSSPDNSDETGFIPKCPDEMEFRCNDSKSRCIPRSWIMDGKEDCTHGEDENTTLVCQNSTEFQCPRNKRCIPRRYVNDGFSDCPGGGDEGVTGFACIDGLEFRCDTVDGIGRCLPRGWVGNGIEECSNGEDERAGLKCLDGEFACLDRRRCLPRKYLCDGSPNCRDGSDEIAPCSSPSMYRYKPQRLIPWSFLIFESGNDIRRYYPDFRPQHDLALGFKCYVTKLEGGGKRLVSARLRTVPQVYIASNRSVCSNEEDACFHDNGSFTCARCLDGAVISKSQVCDGVIDCRDLSDECMCGESDVDGLCEHIFAFRGQPEVNRITSGMVCNGKADLVNGTDEAYCSRDVLSFEDVFRRRETFTCSTGTTNRTTSGNRTKPLYCDGTLDCPSMEDECTSACYKQTNQITKCFPFLSGPSRRNRYYYNVTITAQQGRKQLLTPSSGLEDNTTICKFGFFRVYMSRIKTYKWKPLVRGGELCQKHKYYHTDLDFLCDIEGVDCPWFHVCEESKVKIAISRRCDLRSDCKDQSDERNCSSETHFYCRSGDPLFIPQRKVRDGRSDCSDRSDESRETAFSSGTEMLKNSFLRHFLWCSALAIILCNAVVLRKHFRRIKKISSKRAVSYCNTYLLISLAFSDAIYGVVLLAIGIKSLKFSGKYYEFDLEWRSSLACNMIGIFTVISSQTSMNLLVLMTGLRVYVTYFPFMKKRINFNVLVVLLLLSLGVSIFLASFPVWGNPGFINFFYIKPSSFLDVDVVTRGRVESYVWKTEVIALRTNFSHNVTHQGNQAVSLSEKLGSWFFNSAEGRAVFPNRPVDIRANFAFYSSSSVCLPDFFSEISLASDFSLFLIYYNLSALLVIAIGYFLIFYESSESAQLARTAANKKMNKMMTRIFLIVLTDTLCWLPIIIMSIVSHRGHQLPEIVHPLSSIVFMPINSLLNPVIYARMDKIIKRYWNKMFSPLWNKCCPPHARNDTLVVELPMKSIKVGQNKSSKS